MWQSLYVPEEIQKAIGELGFEEPSPIQREVLPYAIRDYADILGSAPTGSGKTLAFGVPLLTRVQEAKRQFAERQQDHTLDERPTQLQPSKKAKKRRREKNQGLTELEAESDRLDRKRRKQFDQLSVIEELDPDTMQVVRAHDISRQAVDLVEGPDVTGTHVSGDVAACVRGLVILPTRELALQVTSHIRALAKYMASPGVSIEPLVGGISIQKQERLLRQRRPDVIVATPGRLWEFIQQEHPQLASMPRTLSVVVFDEADRLVESQHFAELGSILQFIKKPDQGARRQTLVFSATLTFVHSHALMPGARFNKAARKLAHGKKMDTTSKLSFLRNILGLSPSVKVVDLSSSAPLPTAVDNGVTTAEKPAKNQQSQPSAATPAGATGIRMPEGLLEYRLTCASQPDKDTLLVWLLMSRVAKHGRSLIFVNSKSGARRLSGVLRQCPDISSHLSIIHADMVQKQRLRSLERFQGSESSVVLATDVAARGLDFASCPVTWVVHFDVPHTTEVYIHRCGRTARANRSGTSVILLEPGDIVRWRKLARNLSHLPADDGVPDLPELSPGPSTEEMAVFGSIVQLMRQIDVVEHNASKKAANREWFRRTAREADIILDSDVDISSDDETPRASKGKKRKNKSVEGLRRSLNSLISDWRQRSKKERHLDNMVLGKKLCSFSATDCLTAK
uniref:ATP-dependent RNA helicase n=1 Tax=Mesocestoides corti TaxID=53468 RepID=A0A5K3EXS7_MESCO